MRIASIICHNNRCVCYLIYLLPLWNKTVLKCSVNEFSRVLSEAFRGIHPVSRSVSKFHGGSALLVNESLSMEWRDKRVEMSPGTVTLMKSFDIWILPSSARLFCSSYAFRDSSTLASVITAFHGRTQAYMYTRLAVDYCVSNIAPMWEEV